MLSAGHQEPGLPGFFRKKCKKLKKMIADIKKSIIFASDLRTTARRIPGNDKKVKTMKAKVQTIIGGKVRNHRGFVDAEKWIDERINFLLNIYKFDDYNVSVSGKEYRLAAWRRAGKSGTNGKAMEVTHIVTIVD